MHRFLVRGLIIALFVMFEWLNFWSFRDAALLDHAFPKMQAVLFAAFLGPGVGSFAWHNGSLKLEACLTGALALLLTVGISYGAYSSNLSDYTRFKDLNPLLLVPFVFIAVAFFYPDGEDRDPIGK